MKLMHVMLGAVVVAIMAASVFAGVYLLRAHEGGGLQIVVTFTDTGSLTAGDDVLFGDKLVGRVETVTQGEVRARIGADSAYHLGQGSRFWVQNNLGKGYLFFDTPPGSGSAVASGARFAGLEQRPDPDPSTLPPPLPRRLDARPAWLCDVRVVSTLREGEETVRDLPRRAAGVIVRAQGGSLLILAPGWLFQRGPDLASERVRVELTGGEYSTAELVVSSGTLCLLSVTDSAWQGPVASLWPDALPEGQTLLLADFESQAWTAAHKSGGLEFRGTLAGGLVALVDGLNVAGFALPAVGERFGARWIPVDGAATLLEAAARAE